MYYYIVYDQVVKSDFELPEGKKIDKTDKVDVEITFAKTSMDIKNNENTFFFKDDWYFCNLTDKHFVFHVVGFDFEVTNGNKICVFNGSDSYSKELLRTFTLGTAFGMVLMQKGFLPIHGATIEKDGKATVIVGNSGAGKSAIMEAFIRKGYKYIADDVSVAVKKDDRVYILPAYYQRKLSLDVAELLNIDTSPYIKVNEDNRDKLLIRSLDDWHGEALPLHNIVEIYPATRKDGEYFDPIINEIDEKQALMLVIRNLYRLKFYQNNSNFPPQKMKQLLELVKNTKFYQLIRPMNGSTVDECMELIERTVL